MKAKRVPTRGSFAGLISVTVPAYMGLSYSHGRGVAPQPAVGDVDRGDYTPAATWNGLWTSSATLSTPVTSGENPVCVISADAPDVDSVDLTYVVVG